MPLPEFRRLFRLAGRPPAVGQEIDAELAFHFEAEVARLEANGLSPAAAAAEARRRFGDVQRTRAELVRLERGRRGSRARRGRLEELGQDLGYALRGFRRRPVFAAGVVLTLGLGIGANATMVGIVDRLLFKPPSHVTEPERLGRLILTEHGQDGRTYSNEGLAWLDFVNQQDRGSYFENLAASASSRQSLGRGPDARQIRVQAVTASWFPTLGTAPAIGRGMAPEEDRAGAGIPVAILSDGFWRSEYGARPDAIGARLFIGSQWYTVIGVAPPGFNGLDLIRTDVWISFHAAARDFVGPSGEWRETYSWQWVRILARMRPGVSHRAAAEEATQVRRSAVANLADVDRAATMTLEPVRSPRFTQRKTSADVALWLTGVAGIVLLIASANVTNLLLARAVGRRRELAVRLALGVGRGRLVRQLLVESASLALLGGLVGLVLAWLGGNVLRATFLGDVALPGWLDARLAIAIAGMVVLTALVTGLPPALMFSRPEVTTALRSGAGDSGNQRSRLRAGLLVTQAALSMVLLIGAGLFVRSLSRVVSVEPGFDADRVIVADVDLDVVGTPRAGQFTFYEQARARIQQLPGVQGASIGIAVPLRWMFARGITIPGRDSLPVPPGGSPKYSGVTPDFFETVGLPIRRGRGFTELDRPGAPRVMVANEAFAAYYWPGEEALGQCVKLGRDTVPCTTVVGIAANAILNDIREEPAPQYYVPLAQAEQQGLSRTRALFVRSRGPADELLTMVRREFQALGPNLPYASVSTLQSMLEPQIRPWRLGATMFGVFGGLAVIVAGAGMFSVLSYTVAQRTREFGVRAALGASPRRLVAAVITEGTRTVVTGLLIGAGIALVLGRFVAPLLFEVSPRDPLVFGTVSLVLLAAAVLAALGPARRAMRSDPIEALRSD
jgi:predicted permease